MATFNYIRKNGTLGSLEAPDSATALKSLPPDADPTSGVSIASTTAAPSSQLGTDAYSQQLAQQAQQLGVPNVPQNLLSPQQQGASQSQAPAAQTTPQTGFQVGGFVNTPPAATTQAPPTGTFALPAFQSGAPTSSQPSLSLPNIAQGGASSLTDFANALDKATEMAKQARNANALNLMMPAQGTAMASDFSSLLGNLNAASDNTAQNLIKRALDLATPRFAVQQFGNDIYQVQFDASGKAIAADKLFSNPEKYSYTTHTDTNGNVYAIQLDPDGKPVGQQQIYTAPPTTKNSQYQYDTFTDPATGNIYQVQKDPQSGQVLGQQLLFEGQPKPVTLSPGETYYNPGSGSAYTNPTAQAQNAQTPGGTPLPTSAAAWPTTDLQPGSTGIEVSKLQKALGVQQTGVYDDATTQAVLQLQQKLGVDNSSGPGYYGPKTKAALQLPAPKQSSSATTSDFGSLSKADQTKGINWIYTHSDNPSADEEKFKTDRAFQAWVMSQISSGNSSSDTLFP